MANEPKNTQQGTNTPATAQEREAEKASKESLARQAEAHKAAEKAVDSGMAPAVAVSEETNPKVVAQAGTVPPSMQAPGPSLPHPSSDKPSPLGDTPEMAEARARADAAVEGEDFGDNTPSNVGESVGAPIQCIVKRKFFDERGALIRAGATYWYQRRKMPNGDPVRFPVEVLEPVDKSLATKLRKEAREISDDKLEAREERRRRRDAFARMALETE